MIKIPTSVLKLAGKAGNWIVKNSPTIMTVAGGAMAVGGAVMACEATLHADEVLDRHKQKMARIQAAVALNAEAEYGDQVYTEQDMKRDKAVVYFETAIEFVKLYAPAFVVGMGGVGLMEAAFWITERRRAAAIAALSSLQQLYQSALVSEPIEPAGYLPGTNTDVRELDVTDENDVPGEQIIVDPDKDENPFWILFDETNPNWSNGSFLLNRQFIETTLQAFNYKLSGYRVPQVWINNVRQALGKSEKDWGYFYGWNALTGDQIEWDIVPFIRLADGTLLESDDDTVRSMELNDVQTGYALGVRLMSSSDGFDDRSWPRYIYDEVFGK